MNDADFNIRCEAKEKLTLLKLKST